ncbi:Imm1 family immunity protein [Allokutzneria sp. A3M-2-11 16]|uniref:Imm1 family immunity protein n=1 Tax=Allokutzneria sp. A3M-2-11 16 TaxID=2962043 RepID=UPI0035A87CBA
MVRSRASTEAQRGDVPQLLFDLVGGSLFPVSATVRLDRVRAAVAEFAVTGRRSSCLSWQPARLV